MKLLPAVVLCLLSFSGPLQAAVRWNTTFNEVYRSAADGADVSFNIHTPPQVDGVEKYPLLIMLSGGLRITPNEQFPHFQARPLRTGIWGYRSISTYDAMQVVRLMKQNYPIDPDRVYLFGASAGGSGAMHLASCWPDEFAAVLPLIAAGNFYPLQNFFNLPVAFHHGDRDWVSSICNVRVQARRMQALGCPTVLKEYPGAGHGIPGSHEELATWLFARKRNPAPLTLRHECETPSLGRSYWLKIEELHDPHQRAHMEAEITDGIAAIRPRNVTAFSLKTDLIPQVQQVQIGKFRLETAEYYRQTDGVWQIAARPPVPHIHPYEAGGAANLYQGDPLLIVYGTQGEHAGQLKAAAERLATCGGPSFTPMRRYRFPVVADKDLTKEQQANHNLILVGRPGENAVTEQLWPRLPLTIDNNVLSVANRAPLTVQNQVLSLLHPNPAHPGRLVYIVAPYADATGINRFSREPQHFLPGSDGFDRISQPDLVVQDLDRRLARRMYCGKDWQWLSLPGAGEPLPPELGDRTRQAMACLKVMLGRSEADFALWWGPADKGMWGFDFNYLLSFDPATATVADFRTQHRECETTLGSVTGAELKDIWNRWGRNGELISYPTVMPGTLDDDTEYRLHIPMDLYIKLGRRQQNLLRPEPGPAFTFEEVISQGSGRVPSQQQ